MERLAAWLLEVPNAVAVSFVLVFVGVLGVSRFISRAD